VLALALVAIPAPGAGRIVAVLLPLGGIGLLGVFFALVVTERFLALALLAFAAEFATRQLSHPLAPAVSIGYAAGLLALCELVSSVATLRSVRVADRAAVRRRLVTLVTAAAGAAAASAVALAGAGVHVGAALLAACIGLVAAALLLGGAVRLVTR
jgi:hypothetical protein